MTDRGSVVLILGSGPNVLEAVNWHRSWFDMIVVMNNAWRVRPDWNTLVFPEDFPAERMPPRVGPDQSLVDARSFVRAQNAYGGFVFAGATMAFTTGYWALDALKPGVMAFMGCDMMYPDRGPTHFYGAGTADPLRPDITLRDLGAKSARLWALAAAHDCTCVNLSGGGSQLLFPRCDPDTLRGGPQPAVIDLPALAELRAKEDALGYTTPDGRYGALEGRADLGALDALDQSWRALFMRAVGGTEPD